MESDAFHFGDFRLDMADRRLSRDGETVELNARYLDALILLVREHGRLVSKDRFLDEVWRGTPVTDEALTQCVRSIRRCLGDDAGRPRFIETVPKYGYRFIAPVSREGAAQAVPLPVPPHRTMVSRALAGAIGGGAAGALGGVLYGVVGSAYARPSGMGAGSMIVVLAVVTALIGLTGGAGVSLGVAAAEQARRRQGLWTVVSGAWGGLMIGAIVKLIGLDAFSLLLGRAPGEITGATEGAVLGGAVGLAAWLARSSSAARGMTLAALTGGSAGALIGLCGGRLLGGSLVSLAGRFPESRLGLDGLGALFGEPGFGPLTQIATSALEAALFSACVVGAMILVRRRED